MAGRNLRNIDVRLLGNAEQWKEAFGELVFARIGVMGPVIFTRSGQLLLRLVMAIGARFRSI